MDWVIHLTVEYLPENVYLGVSSDVQGLVVQADTIEELLFEADDVARILIELHTGRVPDALRIEYVEIPHVAAA